LIRKEHVRCRYGVFKVRASSTRARPTEGRSPGRARKPCPRRRSPSKLNSVRPASEENRHVKRGRRCSRRTGSSDDPSTSSSHQRVQQPPE
jgi:hypothetical protein